jgi:DNA-binding GntR family transcriptional regulator
MAALAAERLRALILRGDYAIAQQLRENELCQILGASRIPVREALHRLAGEGLVEIRPNRGACVSSPSKDELREIAEVCRLLEAHLLRLAVPSLKPDRLTRAEAFLETLDLIDDPLEWARVNWRFHTLLYEAADRPLIIELLTGLRARAERAMLILVSDRQRRAVLNREHRAILTCLRARQAASAVEKLDAHLLGGRNEVLRLLGKK